MLDHDLAEAERFENVIRRAVQRILLDPDPGRFLQWACAQLPDLLGMNETGLDELEQKRLANLLAMAIWNVIPQPDAAFEVCPIKLDAPCPCGSGRRHRDCCGAGEDELPRLSSDLIWTILLDLLPETRIREALAVQAVPRPLFAQVAERWLEQGHPRRAIALLEPLFAAELAALDAAFEPAIDVLCDAYERLEHWRKRQTFLERLCSEGSHALRAAGWQRRCTMAIDEADFAAAEAAFIAALRSDPDNPSTAVLEITLLVARHQRWRARERARFWAHRLRRIGREHPMVMDFLTRAMHDPQEALVESHADVLDPLLLDLQDWLSLIQSRPLPDYRLDRLGVTAASRLPGQLGLFDDAQSGRADASMATHVVSPVQLRAPAALRLLESSWHGVFPLEKPAATQLVPMTALDPWDSGDWIEQLIEHPALADSLEVLDDLATALYLHPATALPWIGHLLLRPLLERAWSILERSLPLESPHQLPWSAPRNRPALRLLFRRYLRQAEDGESEAAVKTLETLLRLNPQDHHGVRAELMNHYLRDGEDELALALARRFPNDALADLAYGEVLALYRLGRRDRARLVLSTAVHRLPRIPHYLTRKRVKRPRLGAGGSPGVDDQAWRYREAMRDVWEAEPGVLAWLRRLTA
ncbi:MAG: hypothetical protein EOM91_01560 [Sphingobacteriia bacterium]|nr:hypothetical protein [Sphingobacteriia bacterium]NCC39336.1 hypothetical protein [Gammaproteobacteria bacterium]